ncbi:hypothetical protein PPERSA_11805 [Pseudocohnilembus persalinus]|uniref:Uncharacterized protein n=1 Tax=Pseudocohnilembus persalinus TaxID=266149 RepID=A0A0V0QRD7_PSEPJ|nr:hypothetical protein PPERSA_11805 [Pseudocohnilembus persalinus]|eukprot:KRX04749.1 hypothetical protein PPERSA_11805 [Pseudocohnilembus persalinus]
MQPQQNAYQQQVPPQQNVVNSDMFGIIIPGISPINQFQQINDMFVYDLNNPAQVQSITFFLVNQLPQDFGVSLYYSVEPYETLQFIGAIGNARPSDTFQTGFPLKPNVNEKNMIKLIIKAEKLENLKSLVEATQNSDVYKNYAKLVAKNLYNFMLSYQENGYNQNVNNQVQNMIIPTNFLEKWMDKFDSKYKFDPNFIYKTSED